MVLIIWIPAKLRPKPNNLFDNARTGTENVDFRTPGCWPVQAPNTPTSVLFACLTITPEPAGPSNAENVDVRIVRVLQT